MSNKTIEILKPYLAKLASLRQSNASVTSRPLLQEWMRGPVRQAIPYRCALILLGEEHSFGMHLDEVISIDVPNDYLDHITTVSGQIESAVFTAWNLKKVPEHFDVGMPPGEGQPDCRSDFNKYGFTNCIAAGHSETGSKRRSCLSLFDVEPESIQLSMALITYVAKYLDEILSRPEFSARVSVPASASLTKAERDVLKWIRLGKTNWEIGSILDKSELTVKKQVQMILAKTGLQNRTQLATAKFHES
jgi:DNA-binding CsgD family transcriptional regulator